MRKVTLTFGLLAVHVGNGKPGTARHQLVQRLPRELLD